MTSWDVATEPFGPDHPCLAGHFPGNPIIPGTLILDRVIETLQKSNPHLTVSEVVNVKFLRPLQPDEHFTISYRIKSNELYFDCRVGDALLSSGRLKLSRLGEQP
ncbi:MAG: hypothetical protein KZQ93_13045 [Candidatus Thiodiazotropha sp. (ex Monitilora ramsayi)]|nr:hypothetical protein [Candidatus Thiodiazotropha sp. (ex Monitilora ramsayi)]